VGNGLTERETERDRERETERKRGRDRKREISLLQIRGRNRLFYRVTGMVQVLVIS
jgi:hypothetical protein